MLSNQEKRKGKQKGDIPLWTLEWEQACDSGWIMKNLHPCSQGIGADVGKQHKVDELNYPQNFC